MASNQTELFGEENLGLFKVSQQNQLESIVEFIYERHKIFIKKNVLQKPKPWTKDPFLSSYRFCNIYREIDTVSLWIDEHIIRPYERNKNLWFMLCIARLINWPETLQEMMDKGVWPVKTWDPDAVYAVLKDRANRGEKIITGAYIVNSVIPKGHVTTDRSKAYYIPYLGLDPLWKKRDELRPQMQRTLEEAVEALSQEKGWGAFMSYQVIVDLSYSDQWLRKAEDFNLFTSPGPGTTRGMNRLMYGGKKALKKADELRTPMQIALGKVNRLLRERVARGGDRWWTDDFRTGFQELSMSNFSNANCEYDKYCRLLGGEGEPRSRYAGA